MNIEIQKVDYLNEKHSKEILYLLNSYATDPMGGGKPLSPETINNLPYELSKLPHAISIIAYVDDMPAGLINCFESFSTFNCKPVINIHDVIVLNEHRGNGISQAMLKEVENVAKAKGCCKLTLEVLSSNEPAKSSYKKFGFTDYILGDCEGSALFWQKEI